MDPGTVISIVQLSASILTLGSKVSHEFWGNDKVRDKLADLNRRLQTFHEFVKEIVDRTPDAPSKLVYPGAGSVNKTLIECKEFLKQYERTLSSSRSLGGATQRAWLAAGPDSSRLEDFHSRIDRHYMELQHWNMRSLQGEVRDMITSISASPSGPTATISKGDTERNSSIARPSPQTESAERLVEEPLFELPPAQLPPPYRFNRSPVLRATPRNPSLDSIPELPSPIDRSTHSLDANTRRQRTIHSEAGPVMTLLGASGRERAVSSASLRTEPDDNTDLGSQTQLPTSPSSQSIVPGRTVTLHIGSQTFRFSSGCYRVVDIEGVGVIEWSNVNSGTRIRHVLPGRSPIPFTKPDDKMFRVFFLPRDTKHRFEIARGDTTENRLEQPHYQFDHKPDRETFQKKLRTCDYLSMIRALKIHSAKEKDIAIKIHLKVWRRNDQDDEPTFSFAAHEIGQASHHSEFKIRWFKKTPELKGETRLILRVYSTDSDLDYGPRPDPPPATRRSSTIRAFTRRMSGDSNQTNSSRSTSRSPSAGPSSLRLYDCKGKEPPPKVQELGYLEIEFLNSELRKSFISACYEAHRPALEASRRNSTPSPVSQRTPSLPSRSPAPNQGPFELIGDTGFQIPPPSLTVESFPGEVHFNTQSLFGSSRAADYVRIPEDAEEPNRELFPRELG
ncbi:hypothetical protein F4677DRAFT_119527 [Hypoxylon crocopeplum]|nr:hypothetical protein F4677DRAFT_119527 [Hypoxylon crocopeplum]